MKLVSVSLLIEALAARWPDVSQTPDIDVIADFITEYAKDSAFDIPLKTVLSHYDAEPDLFNPKTELPLTPGQYEALYNEDSASAFNWEGLEYDDFAALNRPLGVASKIVEAMGRQELSPTGRLRKSQPQLQEFPKAATAYQHCPFCGTLATYTHRDGLPVCKCPVNVCKGYDRWLEYDDFAALNSGGSVKP